MALTLLNTYVYNKDLILDKVDETELNFIFSILSNEINAELKDKINDILKTNAISKQNETLLNFLNELRAIYKNQLNNPYTRVKRPSLYWART